MPDQYQGDPGLLGAGDRCERVEICDDVLEVGDKGPLAIGATMAQVVIGIDHGSPPGQRRGHVSVAAPMLGIAVDDEYDPVGRAIRVPASVEDAPFRAVEERLKHLADLRHRRIMFIETGHLMRGRLTEMAPEPGAWRLPEDTLPTSSRRQPGPAYHHQHEGAHAA